MLPSKKGWIFKILLMFLQMSYFLMNIFAEAFINQPLNGKHLNVIWLRRGGIFNESYLGPKKGGIMMEYLSERFRFTYTFINVSATTIEANTKGKGSKGIIDYILDGTCDVVAHDTLSTPARYQQMELIPWIISNVELLIPVPDTSANVDALIKPFKWPVWISLIVIGLLVIFALKFTNNSMISLSPFNKAGLKPNLSAIQDASSGNISLYIVGMLLSQGGPCVWKSIASRVVAGVWCLAAFVLVQAYTSTLITYIIAPSTQPLIESIYDIANNPDMKILFEKDRGFDRFFFYTDENEGIFKKLRDRLNMYPYTRCANLNSCVALVKNGNKNVFGNAYEYHVDAIIKDYKENGRCELQLAKEGFFRFISSWGFPKGTPYRESFSKGILEMDENGLKTYWDQWFRRIPPKCIENTKRVHKQPRVENPRLSLKNLTGAFFILAAGSALAILAFILENIGCFTSLPKRPSKL